MISIEISMMLSDAPDSVMWLGLPSCRRLTIMELLFCALAKDRLA
jgi:hypothetical protein